MNWTLHQGAALGAERAFVGQPGPAPGYQLSADRLARECRV